MLEPPCVEVTTPFSLGQSDLVPSRPRNRFSVGLSSTIASLGGATGSLVWLGENEKSFFAPARARSIAKSTNG